MIWQGTAPVSLPLNKKQSYKTKIQKQTPIQPPSQTNKKLQEEGTEKYGEEIVKKIQEIWFSESPAQ